MPDHAALAPVGHLLRRAYHLARENSAALLDEHELTPRQAAALIELERRGTLSQAEIGAAIGMEPANVHGLIARLKRKALIAAERDPAHSRRMRVRLTRRGSAVAAMLGAIADEAERQTLHRLNEHECETLRALLLELLGVEKI